MGQELARAPQIDLPALNLFDPARAFSLPAWLERSLTAVSPSGEGKIVRDEHGTRIGEVPTLPESRMLCGRMRQLVVRRVAELDAGCNPGPAEETAAILGAMFTRYPVARGDEDAAAIRTDSYLDAIGDCPAWALRAALQRWRRGECGVPLKDYDFAPSEARLRRITRSIALVAEGQAIALRRLLSAEKAEPVSDATRERQASEFAGLAEGIRARAAEIARQEREERRSQADQVALAADLKARAVRRAAFEEAEARKRAAQSDEPTPPEMAP